MNQDHTTNTENYIEWKTHPVKRRPVISILVTFFIFLVGVMIHNVTDSQLFTVLALVVLFVSLAKFYLPTSYKLTEAGITIKTTTQTISKEWSQFRSFYPDKNGVLISPFPVPSRLENFRGVFLIFENNRDEVLEFLKNHIEATDNENQINEISS